ncbi:MAG: FtsX-like permease family protein [Bacilli bacterium]|nr:FtsX-like permease family protein [Bacilli bacterium]
MLKKKMFRDIKQNLSQFITIFLMVLIGVMFYVGIEAYMDGMTSAADNFYKNNNIQDLNVMGNLSDKDLDKIKSLDNVKDAEKKLVVNAIDKDDKDKTYLLSFIDSNNISKFHIMDGEKFDVNKKGAWVDNFYAEKNNLKVGDTIKIKYDTFSLEEKILGLINVPDHIYDVKDESEFVPNRENFGFVYLSVNEIPESYIKDLVMKEMKITDEKIFDKYVTNFNYKEYIPYNYIMVDVNKKKNVTSVKEDIEDNVSNAKAIVKIEDTLSYQRYQGEIDEGASYVGIFSGLFLFIAMLSVITTMTRVVKKQKLQIGTMKALGIKNSKIVMHYIGYGFFVSLAAAIVGIILGKYFIGTFFLNMEMDYFEVPNGIPVVKPLSYLVALLVVMVVSFITYLTCRKELFKKPAEALRNEVPNVKVSSLNLSTKGIFKKLNFSSKWNYRDILRNKFRTVTAVVGIVGCCMLIVCAFGMLNSMNHFIKLQFEDLYNFNYKLSLKENIKDDELKVLTDKYGNNTSETLTIETKIGKEREANTIFVTNAGNLVRFQNENGEFIKVNKNNGVYVTRKLADQKNLKVGDTIKWHIYGVNKYYESKIVGLTKDPQVQNLTMTKEYLESLDIDYKPDSLYTNTDLKSIKDIKNVSLVQDINELKNSLESMLSMMKSMIMLIIVFAIGLGAIIIYNMGILSYSEKQYQFATLKVLGFSDKKIRKIFVQQNNWITVLSIIIGLPTGYYMTSWIYESVIADNYDFSAYINLSTYLIAIIGTILVSIIVSRMLSKKVNKIDMVSSLKANE